MTEHEHVWDPVPLKCARYACACGAEARKLRDGSMHEVVPSSMLEPADPTVRVRTKGDGGRIGVPFTHDRCEENTTREDVE